MLMKLRCKLLPFMLCLVSCGQASESPQKIEVQSSNSIDVASLVATKKAEIDARWGVPDCPPKNSCVYTGGREVYYVNDVAANLTLPPVADLKSYGLELGEPDFENVGVKRWKTSINGLPAEISEFENYVYVKTVDP